jgi:hypothetical protein
MKNIFNRNGNGRREEKGFEFREIITVQNERKLEDQQTKLAKELICKTISQRR